MRRSTPEVLMALVLITTGCSGASKPGPQVFTTPPTAYHVVYQVTAGGAVSTEDLWVVRPFESVDVSLAGPPPGHGVQSRTVTRFGRQLLNAGGGSAAVLEVPPDPAPLDARLDAVVADAVKAHDLIDRGVVDFDGIRCHIYRSATTLRSLSPMEPVTTKTDHVDTCVDDDGIILDERTFASGRLISERVAVQMSVGAPADPSLFNTPGTHVTTAQGGGVVFQLTPDSKPPGEPFWSLGQPSPGFTQTGRYGVIHSQTAADKQRIGAYPQTTVDDVWVRGPDVIVLEQGPAPSAIPSATGAQVDVGALGTAQLGLGSLESEVTAHPGQELVQIRGTVPPSMLVSVAASLTSQPAGTLTTIPGGVPDGP